MSFFFGKRFKCPKHVYIDIWPILGRFQPNFGKFFFGVRNFERQKNRFVGQKIFSLKKCFKTQISVQNASTGYERLIPSHFSYFGPISADLSNIHFLEKMRFWHFFDVADFGRKFRRNGRTHESWPEMCSPGSGDAFSSSKHLPTTSRSKIITNKKSCFFKMFMIFHS